MLNEPTKEEIRAKIEDEEESIDPWRAHEFLVLWAKTKTFFFDIKKRKIFSLKINDNLEMDLREEKEEVQKKFYDNPDVYPTSNCELLFSQARKCVLLHPERERAPALAMTA